MRKRKNRELNRLTVEAYKKTDKLPLVVVLDNIRSLSNIGSIFRTADAMQVESIVLCGITATPPHRELHKTALGAEESVDWSYEEDILTSIAKLKAAGYTIVAVEQVEQSVLLNEFEVVPRQKYAVVLGNEVKGVQQEVVNQSDLFLEIPQFGTKHSLNVSVSAGMVLWEFCRQLKKRI